MVRRIVQRPKFSPEVVQVINRLIDQKADAVKTRRELVAVCRDADELVRAVNVVVTWLKIGGR